ncbi:MAG TPA: UDP-glucose--hexose-1-phosphate uridylyltransferase, partial [Caldilineaceae bacterium]|nr:UDP-glucose--hexose-1-phosphate uridylyltransferase [Caldilineaceae bacterium]
MSEPAAFDLAAFEPTEHPHRRYNPLTGEWVLVSPHRTKRPWQGQVEKRPPETLPSYDPTCYLCPGNERAGGARNPHYTSTFVFTNDFAALLPSGPRVEWNTDSFFRVQAETGICRVLCFSPRHDLTLPEMTIEEIRAVVDVWCEQTAELGDRPDIAYVQIFENRGAMMGASNPHPHGQLWANFRVPQIPEIEDRCQARYYAEHGSPLLVDYLAAERDAQERLVVENETWAALVPFWAVWPFETLVLPRRHVAGLPELTPDERTGLADLLKRLLTKYDNLFETSFPYSMGWHGRPVSAGDHAHWQLHAHFYP